MYNSARDYGRPVTRERKGTNDIIRKSLRDALGRETDD